MDLTLLTTLKQKVTDERELSAVVTYFFDHFGEVPEFLSLGEETRDEFLEQVLMQVAKQLFAGSGPLLLGMRLIRLPEHGFIHGSVALGGKQGTLLYFEETHAGVMALAWSSEPPETKYVRFRGQPLPPGPGPRPRGPVTPSVN